MLKKYFLGVGAFLPLMLALVVTFSVAVSPAHASPALDVVNSAIVGGAGAGAAIVASMPMTMPTPAAPLMSTAQAEQVFTDGFVVVGWLIAAILLPLAFLVGKRLTSWVLGTFKRNLR